MCTPEAPAPDGSTSRPDGAEAATRPLPAAETGGEVGGEVGAVPEVPRPGEVLAGRYTVLSMLGQGGMGVVLSVYDARLDRRVALKLRRGGEGTGSTAEEARAQGTRMVREAQAMARLSHPNVVSVYDAGELDDGSFYIAMEEVRGQTLRTWQSQGGPAGKRWPEVLAVYAAAGRGLAAAHAAGLIHRDFKPENVLVGDDGRVRVTDFGLASASASSPRAPEAERAAVPGATLSGETPGGVPLSTEVWASKLTVAGVVMGTPRYIAPELLRGETASPHSDMFAFCVALYEALYGQPAFPGETPRERLDAQVRGQVQPPPSGSAVPAWVTKGVLRGLSLDVTSRPASLEALLDALEANPDARRRGRQRQAVSALAAAGLLGLAAAGWWQRRPAGTSCDEAAMAARLSGVWDEGIRSQLRLAFTESRLVYAADTFSRVEVALTAYAHAWQRAQRNVCLALEAGPVSEARRREETCLERRRSRLKALTEVLAQRPAPETVVKTAVVATQSLESLEACADERAAQAAVAPPSDASLRAKVEALQSRLDRLSAQAEAGRYQEAMAEGTALLADVEAAGWEPLLAWTLLEVAALHRMRGEYSDAEAKLRRMLPIAARARDDVRIAEGLTLLATTREALAHPEEAVQWQIPLEVAAERTGDDRARASVALALSFALVSQGKYEEALQHQRHALALREKSLGPQSPEVGAALKAIGTNYLNQTRYAEAEPFLRRAAALVEAALGPLHPDVGASLASLGVAVGQLGRLEEAEALGERTLALWEKSLGPDHPHVGNALHSLALVRLEQLRFEEAIALSERALQVWQRSLGEDHPMLAGALTNLAIASFGQGRFDQSIAYHARSLALEEKALGPEHPEVALVLNNLGEAHRAAGHLEEARVILERSVGLSSKSPGPPSPPLILGLHNLGEVLLEEGRLGEARAKLEVALAGAEETFGREQVEVAGVLVSLGSVLTREGHLARARVHLERAHALWEKLRGPGHPEVAGAETALAELSRAEGNLLEARRRFERSLSIREAVLPAQHFELCQSRLDLADVLWRQGEVTKSLLLLEQAQGCAGTDVSMRASFALAKALWETRKEERPRARQLAREALRGFEQWRRRQQRAEVAAWLAAHP